MTEYVRNSLTGALGPVNSELTKIKTALDSKLDRKPVMGQANHMEEELDMNGYRIINYPDAVGNSDLVTKGQVPSLAPVQSVNGQTGDVTIVSDVNSVNGQTGDVVIPIFEGDIGGIASFATTAEIEATTPTDTGARIENRERANAQYVLREEGYTALPGDLTAANGRVWELQGVAGPSNPYFYAAHFGASSTVDSSGVLQSALDRLSGGGTLAITDKYRIDSGLRINNNDVYIKGHGRGTGFNVTSDLAGDCIVIEASDPTTTTIFRVCVSDIEIDASVAQSSGSLLRVTEAAYCTFYNISIQDGFIGFHGQGLRACEVDKIHVRSGVLYESVQAGSRFMLLEDSPRPTVGENVETFLSNFNLTTNGANAYIEYGLEVREADGIWFDSGHIRGAKLANCFINSTGSPQLLGLKFDNVWFDGLTDKCLLIAGVSTGFTGFLRFNDCDFTGASINAVHIQSGSSLDWVEFNNVSTWQINAQIAWNIQDGENVIINGFTAKALNASNAAFASMINVGANVSSININGGDLFDSPNVDNAIVIAAGVEQATINGFSFKDLADSAGNILIQDPANTIFNTAGCTTDQNHGYVTGNTQFGEFNSVATNTAVSVDVGEIQGCTLSVGLKLNMASHGLIALETVDPANIAIISGGVNLDVATGVLTGTTGAAGKLTVSITDSGVLYFENRTGVTRSIVWKILSRNL